MTENDIEAVLSEFTDRVEQQLEQPETSDEAGATNSGEPPAGGVHLDRSFVSEYLDELIIAILFRCDEANGMDIIREFTHRFGVQFSPGTVYPHLHSLEDEGILICRERVQTKEYSIDDPEAAAAYLGSVLSQLSCLEQFMSATVEESVREHGL
ncbi:MAG: transcriptional regulator PadR-like family [halophilic archaeon J07HX64]|jgi:Transcriptional regulator PadR-like family.|nr:MAG: transcriptional regulator PadR-like family [halophilic archaeon J07HX64]